MSPTPEAKKKVKKSKKHRKRRGRYSSSEHSTTSSNETSSSESVESHDDKLTKIERFHVMTQDDINKYCLPAELAEYANEYCNKLIPEKEIKASILYGHPDPNNIKATTRLDSFMRDILKDNGKVLLIDSILEKVHNMTRDAYGPLATMQIYLEEINSSRETADVDIDTLITCTLGQAINSLLYHRRRCNVLPCCMLYSD